MKKYQKQQAVPCFRRWENKSYAAFNSLHKCVKIGVLSMSYSLVSLTQTVNAQTDTIHSAIVQLEAVEVNADAAPDVFMQTGRTITQVSRTEIERAPAQDPVSILQFVPGVDLRQRGPYGSQADLSIRGSSFDQTIVLLNGINISDPQTGHYALNLPIDLASVEKIEVLEGPASRIFGTNALGGAVNFITGADKANNLQASLSGGQYGFYKLSLSNTVHVGKTVGDDGRRAFTNHTAISKTGSDGYMHNSDFDQLNVYTQNKWNNARFPLDVQLGYSEKAFGANGFYGAKYPDQFEALRTFFAAVKGATTGRIKLVPSIYWRRNFDNYVLTRNNPAAYQNFHRTDVFGAELKASLTTRIGTTNVGILSRNEQIYSTSLGKDLDSPMNVPHSSTDRQYGYGDNRFNLSLFGEQNLRLGKWSASVGVLLNHNNYTGSRVNVYPGIELAWHPAGQWKLYAAANRSMRLPTFTDLYYHGPMNIGNPDLKPEQCTEYEAGANWSLKSLRLHASYFLRNTTDAIDWIWHDEDEAWHTQNLTDLRMQGISLAASCNMTKLAGSDSWLRTVSANYDYLHGNKASENYRSNYVLDYLKHRLIISLDHRIAGHFGATWKFSWQSRNGGYSRYIKESNNYEETPYQPFAQIDLRVYYGKPRWNAYVEASNLTNERHQDIGNITLPGIWLRAGINVTVK